jgi:drug/metabolite transporter (DMT)-like permease
VSAALVWLPRVWRAVRAMRSRELVVFTGIGAVIALHWLTFYGSVKLANASVAATGMAIAPVVTALIEPWLMRTRFQPANLLLAVLVIPGVVLIIGGIPSTMQVGFWVGALSGALAGAFNAFNKLHLGSHDATGVTAVELAAAFLLVAAVTPWLAGDAVVVPNARDFGWLLALAIGCTLVPFVLSLVALRHVSAFTAQLAINLEPVYAVAIAAVFLGETRDLDARFYFGVVIVLAAVFAHAAFTARHETPPPSSIQ